MTDRCISCNDATPFVTGMSLCRSCLRARVDDFHAERAQRLARRRQQEADAKARLVWQRPLNTEPKNTP